MGSSPGCGGARRRPVLPARMVQAATHGGGACAAVTAAPADPPPTGAHVREGRGDVKATSDGQTRPCLGYPTAAWQQTATRCTNRQSISTVDRERPMRLLRQRPLTDRRTFCSAGRLSRPPRIDALWWPPLVRRTQCD
eukprot:TRINITY_DN5213_c0_g1_i1.p2 TRINITY_DN5213_c0_g1~~TRINITY_DN5213_c0_g1_i1.p2  ORF type:complete len:138 (-),score=6.39 TRINITY_DN5213_c0_g1_i1:713-1126(-)